MSECEGLIELIKDSGVLEAGGLLYNDIGFRSEQLADYLLENGVIVPPCKVGDTVYAITEQGTCEIEVESIHCWISGMWKFNCWSGKGKYRVGYELSFDDFGKTVFLTKAEAEKALKER